MFRTELLLILPLVVAVKVGQASRGYSYYGTSKVRDQRPQPINGQSPLLLPRRPMPVTGPVTAAPDVTAASSPVLDGPSTPAAPPTLSAEPTPYPDLQPLGGNPEATQEIVQAQEPAVLPERNAVPFPEPLSFNVTQSHTPVALPHLLPKPLPVRELGFGQHLHLSVPPMIYYPTVTYPTQTPSPSYPSIPPRTAATQAPPVVVTTQSHPAVTQASGQDFQCKEENGYYSVEHECYTLIACKQNRAMKYACPDGLHFNPAAKHYEYPCDYPSEVKCVARNQDQNPKPTYKCPNQYGFYSMNDGDSSKFIRCQEGLVTIMNCPTGQAFNPQTSRCDWTAHVPQ